MQGIVLIDEIETHLHVSLQKKILPFLTNFFPKIQFIVSTHSPFVLSSLANAMIYDLENKIRVEDLSPYAYDAVVERYFDVDKYSDHIKQIVKEYETLVNNNNKTEEEQFKFLELRNYLKKVPADFAPELVAHFQKLELQKV
jgi:predicted ATP-binding protein involved in virulence